MLSLKEYFRENKHCYKKKKKKKKRMIIIAFTGTAQRLKLYSDIIKYTCHQHCVLLTCKHRAGEKQLLIVKIKYFPF